MEANKEGYLCLLSGGAPDSPVHHRTVTVACPVQIAFLIWRSRPLKIWSRWRTGHYPVPPSDRWLSHASRTDCAADRWLTGQSGAPPDSLVNYSHTPLNFSRERPFHRSPAWRTGHCPVPPSDRWLGHASRTDCAADRWLTGQSGAPPDSPVNYSRTPLIASRERRLRLWMAHRTVRCTTGQSGDL